MLGNLMQQCLWSVMIVQIALPLDCHISISRNLFLLMIDELLTVTSRHRKRHDRPLTCTWPIAVKHLLVIKV